MAIWDQGVNRFGKDIQQVCMTESSGGEPGGGYVNNLGFNTTGEQKSLTQTSNEAYIAEMNRNAELNSQRLQYLKNQMLNLKDCLNEAEKIMISDVGNPSAKSFVYQDIISCISVCQEIGGKING